MKYENNNFCFIYCDIGVIWSCFLIFYYISNRKHIGSARMYKKIGIGVAPIPKKACIIKVIKLEVVVILFLSLRLHGLPKQH